MKNPKNIYWNHRLEDVKQKLCKNNFQTFVVQHSDEAANLILNTIVPESRAQTISYGGSATLKSLNIMERLYTTDGLQLLRPDDPKISIRDKMECRRQALLVDLYITGTNAITEKGQLVNLDMIGNRVGALTFGPRKVVVIAGRNKIVSSLDEAVSRIKNYAAPVNAMRLDCKTPCVKTGRCEDCDSPGRICNYWTITEKSFPRERITVVLINEDLGF